MVTRSPLSLRSLMRTNTRIYNDMCYKHMQTVKIIERPVHQPRTTYNRFCVNSNHIRTLYTRSTSFLCQKHSDDLSTKSPNPPTGTTEQSGVATEEPQASVGIFKRFKDAYKEHGKVLIGVHLVTSSVWFGAFYYAAASGLDITPLLAKLGASEKILGYVQSSVGNIATAYVMYKIATPARYTVTIFGTYSTVKYLRKFGYMEAPPEGDTIRELMKDSQSQMKEKYGDLKDDMKDKYVEMKDDVKVKLKRKES